MYQRNSHWPDFIKFDIRNLYKKNYWENPNLVKIGQKYRAQHVNKLCFVASDIKFK